MVNNPKVFISYSWGLYEEKVLQLAQRLVEHGVQVILDKWDLKEGQDKYAFMEQAVTDPAITKVLLICDKIYKEKADERKGGVGDETQIISPELYGKISQEKFIPIIFEVDTDGNPYCPAYIKSRIYIDLSSDDYKYEEAYDRLLRNILNEPIYKKPVLGNIPEWIKNETVDLAPLRDLVKQIKGYTGSNKAKADVLLRKFEDSYQVKLKEFTIPPDTITGELVIEAISKMKPLRDIFLDYLEAAMFSDLLQPDRIISLFENVYNGVIELPEGIHIYSTCAFEEMKYFLWELFICTTAFLFHYEKFLEIHKILTSTYFLKNSSFASSEVEAKDFTHFQQYFPLIEEQYKPGTSTPELISLSSDILIKREYKPIITKESVIFTDILLCQMSFCLMKSTAYKRWFPNSHIYCSRYPNQWIKLQSKRYCNKILPLFGVKSIEDMVSMLQEHPIDENYRHSRSFDRVPTIKTDKIGILP